MMTRTVLVSMCAALTVAAAPFDCTQLARYQDWLPCRAMTGGIRQKLIAASTSSQAAQPSVSDASTALLDRTSGPDLVAAGFQLFGAGTRSNTENKSGDGVISASGYALYTSFSGLSPLDPAVYQKGINWRKVSFSAGYESAPDQPSTGDKYKVAGVKILLINRRDVSSGFALGEISTVLNTVGDTSRLLSVASHKVQDLLYEAIGHASDPTRFPLLKTPQTEDDFLTEFLADAAYAATISKLSSDQMAEVDRILKQTGAVEAIIRQDAEVRKRMYNIRRAPQLALAWQGRFSDNDRRQDIHRLQAIFDWGVWRMFEIALNGGYDYNNSRTLGGDTRAGRVAAEGRFELNQMSAVTRGVTPWLLAFAGERKWVHRAQDLYKVQGRLEIPLAPGVVLPVSITYASRSELIQESDVRGQIGFTIDAAKILAALR